MVTIEKARLKNRSYHGEGAVMTEPQRDRDRLFAVAGSSSVRISHLRETHLLDSWLTVGLTLAGHTDASSVVAAFDRGAMNERVV